MLVLDANILMRAVLGKYVRSLLAQYGNQVLHAPDVAFDEARIRLPEVLEKRQLQFKPFMAYFDTLDMIIEPVSFATYSSFESVARQRLDRRDQNDWPILATALALNCPIWTEDTDFFGCGVPTWTSDRVEIYLSQCTTSSSPID